MVFLDTETRWEEQGEDEIHTLRLWVGARVDRRHVRKTQGPVTWGHGETADQLARWLNLQTRGRECLWVYAHNLNFDLVTTSLPLMLSRRGWSVTDFSVRQGAPWLRLSRGRYTITVVDSWSWLPQSLASIATLMGTYKTDLPDNFGSDDAWYGRCAHDVLLLARAVLGLMDWWDSNKLGRWSISGAGSGYNAMRHVPTDTRIVIDPDPALVAQDRLAIRGGRKDAAIAKTAKGGPWVELDLEAAYPTVALHLPLPVKRAWAFDSLPLDSRWVSSELYSPCAEVEVCTDRPRYPVRHAGVTWYPVGTFRTVLAGPELAAGVACGDIVRIGPGQMHKLGHALRPWARWVLDPSREGTVPCPPVARLATKGWGRSALGKYAARGHASEQLPGGCPPGWSITDAWDNRSKRKGAEVTMAGRKWWVTYDQETENGYPAILAWVESYVRVRLGRVLEALDGAWWTADTDGLLVELYRPDAWVLSGVAPLGDNPRDSLGVAQSLCDTLQPLCEPLKLRPKAQFDSLSVRGPQHLQAGSERRMAGLSRSATEVAPATFRVRDWPGLKYQMQHSRPGVYRRPVREVQYSGPTVHRWLADDGRCWPVEMTMGPSGENVLQPWGLTRWKSQGVRLAGLQYRTLQPLSL